MKGKKFLRNQKGFTLIEIIAVLIILGILAAIAIPKYLDLQNDARDAALKGAVAAAKGMLSMAYGKVALTNPPPTLANVVVMANNSGSNLGDFAATYGDAGGVGTASGSAVSFGVTGTISGAMSNASTSGTWLMP